MLLLLLALVLVPLLLQQAVVLYERYQTQRAREFDASVELARSVALAFDNFVRDVLRQELTLGLSLTTTPPLPEAEVDRILVSTAREYPAAREFFWVDPQARVIASSNPAILNVEIPDRDYYQAIAGGQEWFVSDLLQARVGGEPVLVVARGIRDERGSLLGIAGATLLPDKLGALALNVQREGQGVLSLSDRQDHLAFYYPRVDLTWEQRTNTRLLPFLSRVRRGEEVRADYSSGVDGRAMIGAFAPIHSIGWVAGAGRPEAEVMAPLQAQILREGLLFLAVSFGAFLLALITSSRIVTPIRVLSERARAFGRGDLEQQVAAEGPTELKILATAFNQMAGEIKDHQERLQEQNEELQGQSEELQSQNEELVAAGQERERLMSELEQRAADLTSANRELEQFAYVASHDLQEPLRMVASYVQLLARRYHERLDPEADEFIGYAVDGAKRMQQLIDDLLAYSRVGTRGKSFVMVDTEQVLRDVLANLQVAIEESGAVVTHDPLPRVHADPTQLGQVLQNLAGNALKFRGTAPPRVHISAEDKEQEWQFSVRDNGIGIDPQYAERIFLIFQRLHTRAQYPGTGIGLAICRKIVERHGGRIWLESRSGEGATFFFTIPKRG